MTPAIIADSDEEDGYESATDNPIETTETVADGSKSTNGVSNPSESTDPTLFQNVFNEQLQAADEHARKSAEVQDETYAKEQDTSLWDVPSSPEVQQTKGRKKAVQPASTARTKITRGLRRQLDNIGYVSEGDEDETYGEDNASDREQSPANKKRRRLNSAAGKPSEADRLPSTLPVESQGSFLVTPAILSTSQKQQYEALATARSSPPTQSAPLPLGQRCINLASSGSATNVNTPRTELAKSSYTKSSPGGTQAQGSKATRCSSARQRRQASVDVDEEQGHEYIPNELKQERNEEHEEEADIDAEPAPPKKQRGRPKKKANADKAENIRQAPEKPRRKRGRPKKSDAALPADTGEEGDAEKEDERISVVIEEAQGTKDELQTVKSEDDELKTAQSVHDGDENTAIGEIQQDKGEDEKENKEMLQNKATVTPGVSKTKLSTPISVGDSGRPLYRVGLSKRSRIAPLLKMIRK